MPWGLPHLLREAEICLAQVHSKCHLRVLVLSPTTVRIRFHTSLLTRTFIKTFFQHIFLRSYCVPDIELRAADTTLSTVFSRVITDEII